STRARRSSSTVYPGGDLPARRQPSARCRCACAPWPAGCVRGPAISTRTFPRTERTPQQGEPVIAVEDHLADIEAAVGPLPPRQLALAACHGLVLAEDVTAELAVPPFD